MKKTTLFCFTLLIQPIFFAQVSITTSSPSGCFNSTYQLNASTQGPLGTESYTFDTIPYSPETYTGTNVYLSDDAVSNPLPIGFTFCFLGANYTQFYIGSNGWISFSGGQPTTYTSASIPNAGFQVPKNCIMGPWQDWHPGIGGQILYKTIGTAPNRKLVVSWYNVPMFQCVSNLGTFQIVLNESSSIIENHITNKPNCLSWSNGTATQGVHNAGGTLAFVAPGRNSSQWTTTNESTRFTPSGVVWYQGGSIIGYGDSISVTPTSTTSYICQVSLCDGTIYSDTVTVSPSPQASIVTTSPTCSNSSDGVLTVLVDGTINQQDYTYQWNDPLNQTTATASNLGGGVYQVIVSGPNSCVQTLTDTVVAPNPVSALISINPACDSSASGSVALIGIGGVGAYQFSFNNGATFSTNNGASGLLPGQYAVIVKDSNNCDSTLYFTIPSVASPQIDSIIFSNPSCIASDGQISVFINGSTSGLQYSINGGNTFQSSNVFSNLGVGTYLVVIENQSNCFSDSLIHLTNPNSPNISVNSDSPTCGQTDGTIEINATGGTAPYSFSINNGLTYQPNNIFSGLSGNVYNISVQDASGCTATTTATLIPSTLPVIQLVDVSQPPCLGDSGCLTVHTSNNGMAPYLYSFNNGQNFTSDSTKCGLLPGTYTIVVQGINGCTTSVQQTIVAQDSVFASFSFNPSTGQAPLNVTFTNSSINASSYTWSFGDGDSSQLVNPSHVYDPKGEYTIILTAMHGVCVDTMTAVIHIESDSYIFVPNAFTPNNDGVNDYFQLVAYQGIVSLDCIITNQWGNLMAQFNTPSFAWDGNTQAGLPATDGVYYYHIIAVGTNGQTYDLSGFFQLYRN